jgi:cytochrome P450
MEVYGCTFRCVPKRRRRTLDNMSAPISLSTSEAVCAALHDPCLEPPPAPASMGQGATAVLRAAMARFSSGGWHAERRAEVDRVLRALDPGAVRSSAFEIASRLLGVHKQVDAVADLAFRVPTETMLAMLGVPGNRSALVNDVRAIAEVVGRGASASETSDAAAERLLAACARTDRNALAVVSVLYQTHDATAALLVETILANHRHAHRAPAVNQTRRVVVTETLIDGIRLSPGSMVVLDLATAGLEFGAGPHQCPGRSVAEAIVAAIDAARCVLHDISSSVTDDGRPTSILMGPS